MENEESYQIDPDYASHNKAIKKVEQLKDDEDVRTEQIKEVINQEFNKELKMRENQTLFIENQIYKTKKLLHLMRYVLVSSYYSEKGLEYSEEEVSNSSENGGLFDQNRIHPALKKLIGTDLSNLNFTRNRATRKAKVSNNLGMSSSSKETNDNEVTVAIKEECEEKPIIPNTNFERQRQKVKQRIIVGNISRWIFQEDNNLTHKWMMYVRGPKDSPDVSSFISKVVFYLHPSYKPHDVVEVCEPPFHLSRRGWGEFPIRVQIFFTCPLNKPVDVVHDLKLDKTYSGRGTLGNETLVDIYLYEENMTNNLNDETNQQKKLLKTEASEIDIEESLNKPEPINENNVFSSSDVTIEHLLDIKKEDCDDLNFNSSFSGFEHDYCSDLGNIENEIPNFVEEDKNEDPINLDHSYSCILGTEPKINVKSEFREPQEETPLIYGLDESYARPEEDLAKKEPLFYRKTFTYTPPLNTPNKSASQNINFINKTVINSKRLDFEFGNDRVDSLRMAVKKYGIRLPKKFRNVGEVLPYLFMRLPPISFKADDSLYKQLYPFTAASVKEFLTWNTGKLSSAEFSRAKTIHNILKKENIYDNERWTVKTVMMYGRSHGYTPIKSWKSFNRNSEEEKIISSAFQNLPPDLQPSLPVYNFDRLVDIENNTDESPEAKRQKLTKLDISKTSLAPHCTFIREEAFNAGIVLKNEEIVDGVVFNGAERMILEAVKCLANHLVRRALHYSIYDGTYGQGEKQSSGEIKVHHVEEALKERKEIVAIKEFKEKQAKMFFYYD